MVTKPDAGEFQIDNVAMTNLREIMNIRVQRGANFYLDHYLTRIKIKLITNKKERKLSIAKYNVDVDTKIQHQPKNTEELNKRA